MWVIDEINAGEIDILFPQYHSEPRPVYAVYTEKDKLPLKVQVCINYLTEYFRQVARQYQQHRKVSRRGARVWPALRAQTGKCGAVMHAGHHEG